MKADYLQERVGHYGVFNGSRFRNRIVPRILISTLWAGLSYEAFLWSIASKTAAEIILRVATHARSGYSFRHASPVSTDPPPAREADFIDVAHGGEI